MGDRSYFYWKRLHSLLGVVPLGLFLLVHFYNGSYVFSGREAFDAHLKRLDNLPYMFPFEVVFIYLPVLFHGVLGVWLGLRAKYNNLSSPYFGNLRYTLQRMSGIGVFLFVFAHVYMTQIAPRIYHYASQYDHFTEGMKEPATLIVYLLGILGVTYHFANGLWTFGITWGIATGPKAQRATTWAAMVIFVITLFIGYNTIFAFLGMGIRL
ncbi:MAG: succinate dehydrogenase [Terriglobia bacterium]